MSEASDAEILYARKALEEWYAEGQELYAEASDATRKCLNYFSMGLDIQFLTLIQMAVECGKMIPIEAEKWRGNCLIEICRAILASFAFSQFIFTDPLVP